MGPTRRSPIWSETCVRCADHSTVGTGRDVDTDLDADTEERIHDAIVLLEEYGHRVLAPATTNGHGRPSGNGSTGSSDGAGVPVDDFLRESLLDFSRVRESMDDSGFLVEPIVAAGRSHVLTGGMGDGKSLLVLWLVARACLGLRVLGRPAGERLRAVIVDAENGTSDIVERLDAFGIDLVDLHHAGTLAYCHLPNITHGLDTYQDAHALVRLAHDHRADLVVIDTATATVRGPENDADTWSNLARLVTAPLKSNGCSLIRIDHPGKDASKGTRGSSAKLADADVAWQLAPADRGGFILTNKKRRMPWVAARVSLHRTETDEVIGWREVVSEYPAGTGATATALDALGIPDTASGNEAGKALKVAGDGRRREVVLAAQRYRRESGTTPGTTPSADRREPVPEPREETQ